MKSGKLIVLTSPLSEMIDHAGYFIQMAMASLPVWMEGVINRKYPNWKTVERFKDGSAKYAPAGLRVLETVMTREFGEDSVAVCYPEDLDQFIGEKTRVVAVSTHNPLGVTFAAGVYTSIFGSSKQPINSHYSELAFKKINASSFRKKFQLLVGGSGGWQINQTSSANRLGVDCVIEGRAESKDTIGLFRKALNLEKLPSQIDVGHPADASGIVFPDKPTTFGVVEMTTGCGRRCKFCLPDLNPQISLPKEKIMAAVEANVRDGNTQISLATEDLFIWGQTQTDVPFFFPNRKALLGLISETANFPGVSQYLLSHSTMAPAVVDPKLVENISKIILDKSPIHLHTLSSHPKKKALVPLIGLETGSVSMTKKVMPSKGIPFKADDWPSVVIRGLETLNKNNWFPLLTLMIGNPGETDKHVKETLDLIFEMERRNLFGFLVPSVFTPLEGTKMGHETGITETKDLSPLQWQLMLKCWKMNLRPGLYSWWGPSAFRLGGLLVWLAKLRKINGPNFTWPVMMFCGILPEKLLYRMGKIYKGRPLRVKTRAELLQSIRPHYWQYLHEDNGDVPSLDLEQRQTKISAAR